MASKNIPFKKLGEYSGGGQQPAPAKNEGTKEEEVTKDAVSPNPAKDEAAAEDESPTKVNEEAAE